jgi:hypothetical protein
MWNNVIGEQIRRGNNNLLVSNLVLALMIVGWFAFSFRAFYNQFAGPQTIDAQTLARITEPQKQSRYYFKIDRARLSKAVYQDLYVQYERGSHKVISRDVQAVYQLMILPGALLVVKSSNDLPTPSAVSGALVPLPADVKAMMLSLVAGRPGDKLAQLLTPTMLDTQRFQGGGGSWTLAFMLPPFVLALWNLKTVMARREDFLEHPISRQLKKYGDPRELAGLIEHEVRDSAHTVSIGGLTITKNWILSRHTWGMEVRKLDDLVWAHRHELTTTVYFVPVNKTQSMYMYFNDRSKFMVSPALTDCDQILATLLERAPAAIYGFSVERAKMWSKAPAVMIAEVETNRAKLKEQAKSKSKFSDKEAGGDGSLA